MEHHAPHPSAAFEGFYSKFDLPSGAHLALIICRVENAEQKPFMVSFTYVPENGVNVFQREIWADKIIMERQSSQTTAFSLQVPGIGHASWDSNGLATYEIRHSDFALTGKTTSTTPWSSGTSTPESLLVHLPLPLHWHVQSLASNCDFELQIPKYEHLAAADKKGHATVHEEKNWAFSFPSAHMWLQARDGARGFCCAGGQILGLEAFLLGYRSKDVNVDFRPPFAVRAAGLSPFLTYTHAWEERKFELSVQNFTQKLVVRASAPKGTFFALSSPFPEGHRENFLGQSFKATIEVDVFESAWGLGAWHLVKQDRFENASLEFGGGYYPPAGSEDRSH